MHFSNTFFVVLAASSILVAAEPIHLSRRGLLKDAKKAVQDVTHHVESKPKENHSSSPAKPSRDNSHHTESKPAKHDNGGSLLSKAKGAVHHAEGKVKQVTSKVKNVENKAKHATQGVKDRVTKTARKTLGKTSAGRKILKNGGKVEKDASKFAHSKTGHELIKDAKVAGKVGEDAALVAGLVVPGADAADGAMLAAKLAREGEKGVEGAKKLDKAKNAYEKTKKVATKANDKANDLSNLYYTGQQAKSIVDPQHVQQAQQRRDLDWFEDEIAVLSAREAELNDELMYTMYILDQLSY